MKVALINIDSVIPNLALHKIATYHRERGDEVEWDNELFAYIADKVYVSCIFTKNRDRCREWEGRADIGGTGYDLKKKLPPEIEAVKARINWGFTTRGCVRKCEFCFVPEAEGLIHAVGDIYDIWDGKSKSITLMDNNILASGKHFDLIVSQIRKERLKVDFNQGLDVRLLDDRKAELLSSIRHAEYKFSWDGQEDLTKQLKFAKEKLGQCTIFVICGFFRTFEEDLERFEILKSMGHVGYCMRHEEVYHDRKYIQLARWVNQHQMFKKLTFDQFLEKSGVDSKKLFAQAI